jgi:hypothetical protein
MPKAQKIAEIEMSKKLVDFPRLEEDLMNC